MIDIKGMEKSEVLLRLYNSSSPQGFGFIQAKIGDMEKDEAKEILQETTYFDYLKGRVMKVDLSGDEFDEWLYDRDNGSGAAKKALADLVKGEE